MAENNEENNTDEQKGEKYEFVLDEIFLQILKLFRGPKLMHEKKTYRYSFFHCFFFHAPLWVHIESNF